MQNYTIINILKAESTCTELLLFSRQCLCAYIHTYVKHLSFALPNNYKHPKKTLANSECCGYK